MIQSKKKSLEQLVYDRLESAILSRKLAPGTQLVETTLSKKLNGSRTPIRNAIRKLEQANLVEIFPNRGAYVTNPSKEEILQAYDLRKDLEILAAIKALDFLTFEDFEKMERYLQDEELALKDKNLSDYLQANLNFHMTIVAKCQNKFLIEFIDKLSKQTNVYLTLFDVFFEESTSPQIGPKEHRDIILQLKQKNHEELKIILTQHFENAIANLSFEKNVYKGINNFF